MAIEVSGRIGVAQFLRFGYYAAPVTATATPQPTKTHGKSAVFYLGINGSLTNVSTYLHHLGLNRSATPIETSSITSRSKTYIPGPIDTKIPFAGYFDPTFASALQGMQNTTFEYYPAGTATGQYKFSGTADVTAKQTNSDVSKANEIEGELSMSGRPRFTTV